MIVADGHRGKAESATGAQGTRTTRRYRSRMRRRIRDRCTLDIPDGLLRLLVGIDDVAGLQVGRRQHGLRVHALELVDGVAL